LREGHACANRQIGAESPISGDLELELERETGIEPATNGLGSRDSTTELLPLSPTREQSLTLLQIGSQASDGLV
jgi:hypothetical protein